MPHVGDRIKEMGNAGSETLAVATVIGAGLVTLTLLRKGLGGLGDFQLRASTLGAVEWLAYAAVVGGTIRVLQTNYPDSKIVNALGFVY